MEKLRVRCPQCAKLYQVDAVDIQSEAPHFECVLCSVQFYFQFPLHENSKGEVQAFVVGLGSKGMLEPFQTAQQMHASPTSSQSPVEAKLDRNCPKCGAINAIEARECYSCGVLFEKLAGLPSDLSLNAQPSLVRLWKRILEDYDNAHCHEEFLESCTKLGALRYALKQYEDLAKTVGSSPELRRRIGLIRAQLEMSAFQNIQKVESAKTDLERLTDFFEAFGVLLFRYKVFICYIVAVIFVIVGFLNPGQRNLVGVGVALTVLIGGLQTLFKGKAW